MYRKAELRDNRDWLRLRNDRDALFWSGNTRPITWDEHYAWYGRVLVKPEHYLAVHQDCVHEAVDGYGRIQTYTEAEVSFGIAPLSRGQGLGQMMLAHLEEEAKKRRIPRLVAHVHPSNGASMRAFMKQGYVISTNHKHYEKLTKDVG